MRETIRHNAAELCRLKRAISDTSARRTESQEAFEAWQAACTEFRVRYDGLAFPGGLAAAFERLAVGDATTVETAITFVEVRPYFFRAQYHASKFIRLLKRLSLRTDLRERFDAILSARREYKLRQHPGG